MDEVKLSPQRQPVVEVTNLEDPATYAIPAARRLLDLATAKTRGSGTLQERAEALLKDAVRPSPLQVLN